jgi:hypothetical protein
MWPGVYIDLGIMIRKRHNLSLIEFNSSFLVLGGGLS